jgi:short-subunit dehydrogenase
MKKIIITGASDGIGLEIARQLADRGNTLTLVARNREKLERVLAGLPGAGHSLLVADLSKKDEVHKVDQLMTQQHYDVLINNAGVGMYGRFDELPFPDQVQMMNLNMTAVTRLSYSFIRQAKKGDALVNMASTLGTSSYPGAAVYSATKAYVTLFSEALWWENKEKGIFVLAFCPGATLTGFHETSGGSKEMFPKFIAQTPAEVAHEMIRALQKRNKPKTIAGGMNKLMLLFQGFLTRKTVVNMMGGFSPLTVLKK